MKTIILAKGPPLCWVRTILCTSQPSLLLYPSTNTWIKKTGYGKQFYAWAADSVGLQARHVWSPNFDLHSILYLNHMLPEKTLFPPGHLGRIHPLVRRYSPTLYILVTLRYIYPHGGLKLFVSFRTPCPLERHIIIHWCTSVWWYIS